MDVTTNVAGQELVGWERHRAAVTELRAQLARMPSGSPVRLAKRTSNLFRPRATTGAPGLDVSRLDGVIAIDAVARTAQVQGMCTYETLVDATLAHGLMPAVVPQLKTITLGGAVTGLGIESSSFRAGLPHESVRSLDILTGAGEILTVEPGGAHADLFRAFPNSYGSLGYAVRLEIELQPVRSFVRLRHVRFHSLPDLLAQLENLLATWEFEGRAVDFVDGVVFTDVESYLVLATFTDDAPYVSDYTHRHIYYRSIQDRDEDYLSVRDYLWRWDTDWFWCSRAFGAQNPRIRRLWPRRYRRSSVYWKLVGYDRRFGIADRIEQRKGRPPRERVVQDVEVPLERCAEFVDWFLTQVPIAPIWLCPLRLRDRAGWPLYPIEPDRTYVNLGFWSSVPAGPEPGYTNRMIEAKVSALDGHKSLYSDAFYSPAEFDSLYGGEAYRAVRRNYDPDSRLLDLYAKAVQRR